MNPFWLFFDWYVHNLPWTGPVTVGICLMSFRLYRAAVFLERLDAEMGWER